MKDFTVKVLNVHTIKMIIILKILIKTILKKQD
jgi:hypothetical protein